MNIYLNPKTARRKKKKKVAIKLNDMNNRAIKCLEVEIRSLGRKIKALEQTWRPLRNPDKLERLKHIYNERTHYLKQHINKKQNLQGS